MGRGGEGKGGEGEGETRERGTREKHRREEIAGSDVVSCVEVGRTLLLGRTRPCKKQGLTPAFLSLYVLN